MYSYQDYVKKLFGPIAAAKRHPSRKSSSAKSDKDQNDHHDADQDVAA